MAPSCIYVCVLQNGSTQLASKTPRSPKLAESASKSHVQKADAGSVLLCAQNQHNLMAALHPHQITTHSTSVVCAGISGESAAVTGKSVPVDSLAQPAVPDEWSKSIAIHNTLHTVCPSTPQTTLLYRSSNRTTLKIRRDALTRLGAHNAKRLKAAQSQPFTRLQGPRQFRYLTDNYSAKRCCLIFFPETKQHRLDNAQ